MTIETDFEAAQESLADTAKQMDEDASYNQQQVISFLSSPDAYEGQDVECINTHISHVFLVGEFVYKLKKALSLTFLDFSTLNARRNTCEREVDINKKTAPEIYLGIVPVTRLGDGFEIGGRVLLLIGLSNEPI